MSYRTGSRNTPLALVIDDDLSMRLAMKAALTKAGFDVKMAENGRTGVTMFETKRPDLILLDVVMPEMDGFATCSAVRSLPGGEHVQILMVTGLDDTDSMKRAFQVGANDFITKPIHWIMLGHKCMYMHKAGRAFQELDRSKSRLAKAQELAKLGNWEIDLATNEFFCSPEAQNILGIKGQNTSITYDDFLAPIKAGEQVAVRETIASAVQAREPFSIHYQAIHSDGSVCHILNQGETLLNDQHLPEVMLCAIQDVTQLKQAEEEIRRLAFYDGLTGLANRMLFLNRLDHEISSAARHSQIFALLYIDLDQFKRINDSFGHHVGDLLLKKVSKSLQECIRNTDIASRLNWNDQDAMIARLGGDEFTIILSNIHEPKNAEIVARRIIKEVPQSCMLDGHEVSITPSIGISLFPTDADEASTLMVYADVAMYQAKKSGRNNYQFYKENLNIAAAERFSLEMDLARAVENNELVIHFQPKIDLKTMSIVGAEALVRWQHPKRGLIPPDSFISLAEDSGQIVAINEWVIHTACRQWQIWKEDGCQPGVVSVNLSGYQFAQQNVVQVIEQGIEAAGIDAASLEVEITENILMQDNKETIQILQQLKKMGLRIALDDFGTGYSSLSYLTSFQVDTIKIDRSFVMGTDVSNNIIIKAIIAMGHSLGMTIVAEGVETEEQLASVRNLGADEAQGYYFSPAVPPEEFRKLLTKQKL